MTRGLERIAIPMSWRAVRPMKSALTRLGYKIEIRQGPTLWSTDEGARVASFINLIADLYPRKPLAELITTITLDDIAMVEAAWKLDANPESLREVVQAVLNPQQEPSP